MTANTPRKRMSQKRRQHIFTENSTAHNIAPCCVCGKPIHRHNDRWIVEHVRALALLGLDTNTNCKPAHYECGVVKTHSEDLPRIRKAKRQNATGRTPMPRKSAFWKPLNAIYDWKKGRYILA